MIIFIPFFFSFKIVICKNTISRTLTTPLGLSHSPSELLGYAIRHFTGNVDPEPDYPKPCILRATRPAIPSSPCPRLQLSLHRGTRLHRAQAGAVKFIKWMPFPSLSVYHQAAFSHHINTYFHSQIFSDIFWSSDTHSSRRTTTSLQKASPIASWTPIKHPSVFTTKTFSSSAILVIQAPP